MRKSGVTSAENQICEAKKSSPLKIKQYNRTEPFKQHRTSSENTLNKKYVYNFKTKNKGMIDAKIKHAARSHVALNKRQRRQKPVLQIPGPNLDMSIDMTGSQIVDGSIIGTTQDENIDKDQPISYFKKVKGEIIMDQFDAQP